MIFVLTTYAATMVAAETSRLPEANKGCSRSHIFEGELGTALVLLALVHSFAQEGVLDFSAQTALARFQLVLVCCCQAAVFLLEKTVRRATRGHPARIVVITQSLENRLTAAPLMVPLATV